ncbi:hypothetical protein UA08_09328 [Talaromyces atroroseus]|uniref:GLEYA adhesin domain-containing protein n=1 Tax=Talaromyces atroroseus TaxID=1441469 RepID=A0A1Q5Q6F6_TALAT|nr:hypothetical protein UA08_09328 [Talaromyces atroroseus]OKL55424.1 hypothetical protein UA08_09328 [Talaromyces atroroseus]
MDLSHYLTLTLTTLILTVYPNVATATCSCLSDAVSSISADSSAAAFCSQYVTTIWDSTTITTPLATTIRTQTVSALITVTTTVLNVGSTTTTLTETVPIPYISTVTTTVTSPTTECYTGTLFGTQEAPIVTPAARGLEARQIISETPHIILPTPPLILSLEDSLISSACECFLGPSATVTETITDIVGSGTLTATVDYTTIPTTTAYIALVTTWTDIVVITSSTATATNTATTTAYTPVPTNTQHGLNWYYYTSPYAFAGTIPFDPQYFNSPNYNFSGYIENVNEFHTGSTYSTSSTNYTCNAPVPAGEDCGYVVVIFQGYLWARDGPVWHGQNAYSNYQNTNYDYQATYPSTTGSVTIDVGTGDLIPITMLWANGGGPGQVVLTITNPAGTTYSDTTGFFVPANSTCPGYSNPFSP